MEQRPLRLGDLVDDYCPRERRVTNHAIVAIVNNSVRQTRCSTCETEHVFKGAKAPRRRRPDAGVEPDDQAMSNIGGQLVTPVAAGPDTGEVQVAAGAEDSGAAAAADSVESSQDETPPDHGPDDGWPAHRTLIRATLPKIEGDLPPPRPIPEFTMHQRQGRGGFGGFRHGQGWQDRGGGGGRNGFRGPGRSAGGQSDGNGNGNGNGPGRPGQGGGRSNGRKRSR